MNATEIARRARREYPPMMTVEETLEMLAYIGDVDQPEHEHGGFHDNAIQTARSARHWILKLSNLPAGAPMT